MFRITRVVGWALPLLYAGLGTSTALADEPTQRYGYCAVSAHVPPAGPFQVHFSATFETRWPVSGASLESRFQSFVESKYGVQISRYAECFTYATMADAQKYRAEHWPPVPGHPYVETGWAPAPAT